MEQIKFTVNLKGGSRGGGGGSIKIFAYLFIKASKTSLLSAATTISTSTYGITSESLDYCRFK